MWCFIRVVGLTHISRMLSGKQKPTCLPSLSWARQVFPMDLSHFAERLGFSGPALKLQYFGKTLWKKACVTLDVDFKFGVPFKIGSLHQIWSRNLIQLQKLVEAYMISVTDSTYAPWLWGQMTLLVCKDNSDRLSILYLNSFQQAGNAL